MSDETAVTEHEHEAVCGYCGEVIAEPGRNAGAIGHMMDAHDWELPVVIYRGADREGSDGRWTALACKPEDRAWEHPEGTPSE